MLFWIKEVICKNIIMFKDKFILKSSIWNQSGFCKSFNAEHCLMHIIEKWWKYLDAGGHGSTLLIDLSKVLDCIDDQLLIEKLDVYDVI